MADPTKPTIDYSYVAFQQANQDSPFPGSQIDNDLANLKAGIDGTIDALKDVRRADGKLPNGIVDADALDNDLLIGLKTPVAWASGTRYVLLDTVYVEGADFYGLYRCDVSHESALTFEEDLAVGYWELIFDFGGVQTASIEARDKAREWATNPEDDPVETAPDTLYSALHHAAKADASATAAAGSAGAASSSATAASTSAEAAAASAGTADGAASTAQTSAGQAMTAANNAATSETNAATSAGAAADSATAAAASATAAETTLESALKKDQNLAGLTAPDTALTNLGISTAALQNFVKAASASTAFSALALALSGGTQSRSQIDRTQEKRYSLFEWMPQNLLAGILAGTNTTPLTSYIQAALDSNKPLSVPIGTFLIGGQMTVRDNKSLVGINKGLSKFTLTSGLAGNPFYASGRSNIELRNFTIDCTGQAAGSPILFVNTKKFDIQGLRIINPFNGGISLDRYCEDFNIYENYIENSGNHSISLSGDATDGAGEHCRSGRIFANNILNPGGSGINLSECEKVPTFGNTILHTGNPLGEDGVGGYGGIRVTNGAQECPVFGNTVEGMPRSIFLIEASRCPIYGNTSERSQLQAIFVSQADGGLASTDCPIFGNTILDAGRSGTASDAIYVKNSVRCPTSGNVITNTVGAMEWGVRHTGCTGSPILGNSVVGATVGDVFTDATDAPVANNWGPRRDDAIASAATLPLPSDGEVFNITGTTTVTAISGGWHGRRITLRCASGLTFTHGSLLQLNGDTNKTVVAGETISFVFITNGWFQV